MPTNGGPIEKVLYGLNGIPLFTYGMIGITTLVLAYITLTDIEVENPLNSINPVSEIQKPTEEASELIIPSESVAQNQQVPAAEGVQTTEEGVEPNEERVQSKEEGLENTEEGVQTTEERVQSTEEGVEPTGEGVEKTGEPTKDENIQQTQPQIQQDIKKQGGKKRTIRNKKKGRKTIRR